MIEIAVHGHRRNRAVASNEIETPHNQAAFCAIRHNDPRVDKGCIAALCRDRK
jgi:hypothetical protein